MQSNQHSPREREIKSVAAWNGGFEFSVLCFWANTKFPVYWKFPGRFSPFTRKFPSQPEFSPYLDGLVQKKRFFFLSREKFLLDMLRRCHVHIVLALPIAISNVAPGGYVQGIFSACSETCSGSFLPGQIEFLLRDFYFRANFYVWIGSFLPRHMHVCCTALRRFSVRVSYCLSAQIMCQIYSGSFLLVQLK